MSRSHVSTERVSVPDLDCVDAADPTVAGQKAAMLERLRGDGFAVPDGFVIPIGIAGDLDRPTVRSAVEQALANLGDTPVAVRSSSVVEDLTSASYAGVYETVLDVRGHEEVLDAARQVVGTALDRATARGAEAAGVAFSADPVTGDRETAVVNVVAGLGDRLVDGSATPRRVARAGRPGHGPQHGGRRARLG